MHAVVGDMLQLTTQRILWTAGVGLGGFFIGGKGAGIVGADLGLVWGASIGFGFGWIFDQKQPSKWALIVWAITLALCLTTVPLSKSPSAFWGRRSAGYSVLLSELCENGSFATGARRDHESLREKTAADTG